ncbi:hypothetical protein Ae168Ps1_5977 [Pseudonocardia sp. Ae168_Ps1]|uniref:hypothetical protein n=1 Tax=unclassified Pseudonocardia TaxID=2619320 RepID=UPI00094ADDFA|nr:MULTISPECIES: hypothetical protein [unclassified Pseudonocardia]OLL71474.1 hypothetical protein Ae168Ps1_5977 [Pseudonocardia sp. Ae168_Ps1]OLL76978.1 hypothetical protein Ae150APs1_5356c [Pseudonocardia sp. Ae150A_Ps1]OLL88910.1 hypothetical protein Ae263Ps1_5965 [Pseudonocardia sp. Ae263_Ps1]OLL91065.1 hypothetical protein Ae356Ps1_0962c [Pseudonocardia sp. Ae356_Ps1]
MLGHPDDPRGVVLPLDGRPGAAGTGQGGNPAPARNGTPPGPALLLSWRPADPRSTDADRPWGATLSASSELARRLARPGSSRGPERGRTFRLTLPEAFGAEPLLTLAGGATAPGHPGLSAVLPVGDPASGPAPGAGLGLLALTVAAEIAAIGTQHRVVDELTSAVDDLAPGCTLRLDSRLRAAEESLRDAQTELLEHGAITSGARLDTAVANLAVLRHQTHAWISGWERVTAAADPSGTGGIGLREQLGEVGRLGWDRFPGAVLGAYLALVLDARRILLTAADHLLRSPNRPLAALRPLVESDLSGRIADVGRLHRLATGLSVLPLTVRKRSGGMLPHLIADQAATNARTQALFTRLANALRPAPWSGRVVVEVQSLESGELQVLRPV